MEYANKFALIPEETLSKHVPSKKQMTEFDVAMSKILNSSLPDHEKVQQYYELLKRKMNLQEFNMPWLPEKKEKEPAKKEPEKDELPIKQEQSENYDSLIIDSVPQPMKKQAEALLRFLKTNSKKLEWDERGVITYNGQKLEHSNIAELFHFIFSVNKKPPVAAQSEFLEALKEMGVPASIIKNKYMSLESKNSVISPRRIFVKEKKKSPHQRKVHVRWENLK